MASEILQFNNQCFIRKKPAGMHWIGRNDAVPEAKTRIFQPTANFKNFEI